MSTIISAIPFQNIDFAAIYGSRKPVPHHADNQKFVFEFLAGELEALGGKGIIEVDSDGVFCIWDPPGPNDNPMGSVYMAHMLQAGLMNSPMRVIANTAYSGNGLALARSLVIINCLNGYVADRDSHMLAESMPMSSAAWLAHGLIVLENGNFKDAAKALDIACTLDPMNMIAWRSLAVALTSSAPKKAVKAAEAMIEAYANVGVALDELARATYGFALLAAGMKVESRAQFNAAFGYGVPVMTVKQWREWGHRLQVQQLVLALKDPMKNGSKK